MRSLHAAFELEQPETVESAGAAAAAGRRPRARGLGPAGAPSSPASSASRASARRTTSSAAGLRDGDAGDLPRGRRRADRRPRTRRPHVDGAARRGPAALARVPAVVARPGPRLAPGRDRRARDGRCRPRTSRACRRGRSASSGRTTSSSRPAGRAPSSSASRRRRRRRPLAAPLELRKLAGVLGETRAWAASTRAWSSGIGDQRGLAARPTSRRSSPTTMTSLREASGGRPIDREALLDAFLDHLEARVEALRAGFFDVATGPSARRPPAGW